MEKFFELFGKRMEDIFIRSIMPSSMFFVLLIIYDYSSNNSDIICFLFNHFAFSKTATSVNTSLIIVGGLVFLLGYGYIVSLIQQFLDNFIKKDYDADKCLDFFINVNVRLGKLRELARNKLIKKIGNKALEIDNMTDYELYQILGNISVFKDAYIVNTYVDQTKVIFSFFIALIFILFISIANDDYSLWWLVTTIFLLKIAIDMAKSRYRARNIRLYLNYILENENNTENCLEGK